MSRSGRRLRRFPIEEHSSLVIAIAFAFAGCLLILVPLFGATSEIRFLLAGAAFGAALTEVVNDYHRGRDRRETLEERAQAEARREAAKARSDEIARGLQAKIELLSRKIVDMHHPQNALRIGACFAQMALKGELGAFNSRERYYVRVKAKALGLLEIYDRAVGSIEDGAISELSPDSWRELRDRAAMELRPYGVETVRAFDLGFRMKETALLWGDPTEPRQSVTAAELQEAVGKFEISDPFRTWALHNLERTFKGNTNEFLSRAFLDLLISMFAHSYYLQTYADSPELDDPASTPWHPRWDDAAVEKKYAFVVEQFPDIHSADLEDVVGVLMPQYLSIITAFSNESDQMLRPVSVEVGW